MKRTASDVLVETLQRWGVEVVFALHFAESLAKGEPNRKEIALTVIADEVKEMI